MAVVQTNILIEDQCQIESGPLSLLDSGPYGTFVGVYDGHGGPETSRYVNDHLFQNLKGFASEQKSMSVDVIRKAFLATEEGFVFLVSKQWLMKPQMASVGSCCLVGVICGGTLYVANLGDSRAVLGRVVKATGEILAVQLSTEHNASIESVRQELQSMHPDDPQIVVLKHNVWCVKGIIQDKRAIGICGIGPGESTIKWSDCTQVLASVANLLNIRDTELSSLMKKCFSFLVAMADISLRKTIVEEKRAQMQQESKVLLGYTRKAISRLTYLKRNDYDTFICYYMHQIASGMKLPFYLRSQEFKAKIITYLLTSTNPLGDPF